jgi:hypothetical protein
VLLTVALSVAMSESTETSGFARRMSPARAVGEVEVCLRCWKVVECGVQVK